MGKINPREFQGVLKSKNDNRFRYTISKICDSHIAYYCKSPICIIEKNGGNLQHNHIILWGSDAFAIEFFKKQPEKIQHIKKGRIHEFYRQTLTQMIKEKTDIIVFPNMEGYGKIASAKSVKISLFLQLWEGEQEEWMFN